MSDLYLNASEKQQKNIDVETKILVSVIIPIRNEEKHIENCIKSILSQDYQKNNLEIILVDGMSDDRTIEVIHKFTKEHENIHIYHNPNKTVPYAMNIGIRESKGDYIVRIDAHAQYASDYISKCVEYLQKTDACNVGGPMIAVGKTKMQKAIAASYHSSFAMGGGKSHKEGYEGYADTVWLGAYKKRALLSVGLYDEKFTRNQDDELNYQIIKNGGKIYISPQIKSRYYPRSNLKSLFKQFFEYGLWKPAVIKKHKKPARLTHLVPVCFVAFLIIFGIGSIFIRNVSLIFVPVIALYIMLDIYFSFSSKVVNDVYTKLLLCLVHVVLHISYGLGFFKGILRFYLLESIRKVFIILSTYRQKIIGHIKKNEELEFRLKLLNMYLANLSLKLSDDENFIKKQYKARTKQTLNLISPTYYNEKIQWIKLNYKNPVLNLLSDKYEVRNFVKGKIGEKYLVPIYGVYNSIDEVDFDLLPNQFVMKLTNGSSFNYICKNKNYKEIKKIKNRFKKWIKINYYALGREWAYKDIKNRIICEKYLEDTTDTQLKDYKIFCFNGQPKFIQVDYCRFSNHKRNIYTPNWDYLDIEIEYLSDPDAKLKKPDKLDEMLRCATILSKDFPHVRVDFYYLNECIYFGEMTFYHGAGYLKYRPKEFEKQLGDYIDLSLYTTN